jgi:hypothetical protein
MIKQADVILGSKALCAAILATVSFNFVATSYYKQGYAHGSEDKERHWKKELVDADFAQYNPKTGEWQFRKMEDVVTTGLILGKGSLPQIVNLPDIELPKKK